MDEKDFDKEMQKFEDKRKSKGNIKFPISFEPNISFNKSSFDIGEPEEKKVSKPNVKVVQLGKKKQDKGLF